MKSIKKNKFHKFISKNPVFILPFFALILILLVVFIGESYAYFKVTILGERRYSIALEELTLTDSNIALPENMTIENMSPIPDSQGIQGDPYTFDLTNNNPMQVGFAVLIDDMIIDNEMDRVSDSKVKYQLIKNGQEKIGSLNTLGENPLRILDKGKMAVGESNHYSVRFWITENAGEITSRQKFLVKIRVVVTQPDVIDRGDIEKGNAMIVTEQGVLELDPKGFNNFIDTKVETVVNTKVEEGLSVAATEFLNKTYPIGSIYMSENNTNPGELFGGVWEKYSEGRTLIGTSDNKEGYTTAGITGGNDSIHNMDISHTHNYDKTASGTYNTVISHTHNYDKTTAATYNTVIAHTHNYSKVTSGTYSTVISHNHSGNTLVAAIGAVNNNGAYLAYNLCDAPSGLPTKTNGVAYMMTHTGATGTYYGAGSITNWNHGTKIYGNTSTTGSASGAVTLGHTTTATTSTGSASGSATLTQTATATTSSNVGATSGSVSLSYATTQTGLNENSPIDGADPYITVYMWKRVE